MDNSKAVNNPVQPCPWKSNAPKGFHHRPKKLRLSFLKGKPLFDTAGTTAQENRARVNRNRTILKDSSTLRNLNRSTLILSFPNINPTQIDAALALCDNDLSETINLLRLRNRILRTRQLQLEQKAANTTATVSLPLKTVPDKTVTYIPTKYTDVQIVEVKNNGVGNNIKIMEVNNDVLKMLQTCNTTVFIPPAASRQNNAPNVSRKTHTITSANRYSLSSHSEFSPTATSSSSSTSEKFKVGKIIKKQERTDPQPKFLEKALTLYPPVPQDSV